MKRCFFSCVLLVLATGCSREPAFLKLQYEDVDKTRAYHNPMVPKVVREALLGGGEHKPAKPKGEHEPAKGDHGPEAPAALSGDYERVPLRVYLHEKTAGVMHYKNYSLDYRAGGGDLDLADYVSEEKRGTFYFAVVPEFETDLEYEVFLLSNAKTTKFGGETLGEGCGTFKNVTKYFKTRNKDLGLPVSTADGRHVSALAGTYFFVAKKKEAMVISFVEVTDSRFKHLLCRVL